MELHTANSTYSCREFEELLKEKSNKECFDCREVPACWASVNNSIYLCMNCAGIHRGFGVSISYIRSITIDTWNETQINYMKAGGNKRLEALLIEFKVPKSTPTDKLYCSKLLEYHRNRIKNGVNNETGPIPPTIEEALIPIVTILNNSNSTMNKNIYFVSSTSNDLDSSSSGSSQKQNGIFSSVSNMLNTAYQTSKTVASNVKDKVGTMDITNKLYNTGNYTVEKLKATGIIVKDKSAKTAEVIKDTSYKVAAK